jgi:putative heme iron utilization protein
MCSANLGELLRNERFGVLATLSARRQGWPFASITAYALSEEGEPLLLLSDLAEHTRNLRDDPRASLLIQDSGSREDPQAGPRVTLLGTVEPTGLEGARDQYEQRHPQARQYSEMADFRFYVLRVSEARFVSGFGDMGWIDGLSLRQTLAR